MKLNHDVVTTPPRHAATVMLLRDGADGPEVFMVRRHGLSDVLGGAYVFPGGKLDDADADAGLHQRLDTPTDMLHDLHCHRIESLTPREPVRRAAAPERNDPCPCGSGKKYKKCCGA